MKLLDFLIDLLLPSLILLHLFVAPYTKVEESFNLQATHDILTYGTPLQDISNRLRATYDHFDFPGVVPRTFIGALLLSGVSSPIINLVGASYAQLVVRGVLGLYNAAALLLYKKGVEQAFGKVTARWFVLLLSSQFHTIYYASRTLPNMFAFGLTTLAMKQFLPVTKDTQRNDVPKRNRLGIYLMVLAGVIFRSEVAILLFFQLVMLLFEPRISLQTIVRTGLVSAAIALAVSVPIDSYFWQKPIWPELSGFYFNAIQGKSSEWGTSPIHYYFTTLLPKLVLNPLMPFLVVAAMVIPSTRYSTLLIYLPLVSYIGLYSLQPHKETRFIIYAVPSYTTCAAIAAGKIWERQSKAFYYRIGSLLVLGSVFASFAAATFMLFISSFNYPGGEALWRLHDIVEANGESGQVNVHMDVLSCMTGVTLFQQDAPTKPFLAIPHKPLNTSVEESRPLIWHYDKTEDEETLHDPLFWEQFDYVITEHPELAIGKWEIIDSIYGYAGMEFLTPRHGRDRWDHIVAAWNANAASLGDEQLIIASPSSPSASASSLTAQQNASMPLPHLDGGVDVHLEGDTIEIAEKVAELNEANHTVHAVTRAVDLFRSFGTYGVVKEALRAWVTRGWWVGPKLEEKIRILRRVR